MKEIKEWDDATEKLKVPLKARHALHCKRRNPEHCFMGRGISSIPGVKACKVYTGCTYIWWEHENIARRYMNSSEATYFAKLNDKGGRRPIIDEIRDEIKLHGAIVVELLVPTGSRTKGYLRSENMKMVRAASRARRKKKLKARAYTTPAKKGMRSGTGKALVWGGS